MLPPYAFSPGIVSLVLSTAQSGRKTMRGFFPFGCAQGQNDKQEQAKTKYRDSGFARMTTSEGYAGMTTFGGCARMTTRGAAPE